jgi:hypothetical protein
MREIFIGFLALLRLAERTQTIDVFSDIIQPLKVFNESNQIFFSNIPEVLNSLFCN